MMTRLLKRLSVIEVIKNFLAAFGTIWGIIEAVAFFLGDEKAKAIKPYWWVFLILGIIYTLISCWPKNKFCFPLPNRDTKVILHLKNSFEIDGSIIIPINNKF